MAAGHAGVMAKPATTFAPTSISDLFMWLDASNAGSITSSGSPAKVSQWNDLSGNTRHMANATSSQQPTTGATTKNSLNVLDFDGSDDVLSWALSNYTTADPCTIFTVVKWDSGIRVHFSMGSNNGWAPTINGNGGYGLLFGGKAWVGTHTASAATWYRHTLTYAGTATGAYVVYKDGASPVSGTRTDVAAMSGSFWAGGDSAGVYACHLAEVIIYKRVLNSTERGQVDSYLSAKWGI